MPTYSETGHAKNVGNFQDLISFVVGYGASYTPTKASLKLLSLNNLLASCQSLLSDVISKNTAYNNAVNSRVSSFEGIKSLSTRLINALEITDASKEKVADAKGFNRKLQGKRASKVTTSTDPSSPAPTTISSSQQSYDQLIQHFAGLVSVLQSETSYAPNETDLKIVTLTAKLADLSAKNTGVSNAYTAVSNSRIARDKALYNTDSGLVDIANEVKKYIKSIYGASSYEYTQVKGIEFKRVKK